MRMAIFGACCAFLLPLISGQAAESPLPTAGLEFPTGPGPDAPTYAVVEVVSGDLVELDLGGVRTRLRLAGVDVVSSRHRRHDDVRAFLDNLLAGERVYVTQDIAPAPPPAPTEEDEAAPAATPNADAPPEGESTRAPTAVFLFRAPDGLFVNLELVRQGYARAARDPFRYSEWFRFYQETARKHRKGLWQPQRPAAAPRTDEAAQVENPVRLPEPFTPDRPAKDPGRDTKVYITPSGTRYHRADCSFLRNTDLELTLAEAHVRGLKPCTRCDPPVLGDAAKD